VRDLPEFMLDRVFDASSEQVWRVWTDPRLLAHWYGPGVETVIHRFDLEPGGEWRNEMKMAGGSNFQKMIFKEVRPVKKLVWHHCSTDEAWNLTTNPMMPDWPRTLLTTVSFSETGGQTSVRLSQLPQDASDAEIDCFADMKDGMSGGWGKGYELIDELLTQSNL